MYPYSVTYTTRNAVATCFFEFMSFWLRSRHSTLLRIRRQLHTRNDRCYPIALWSIRTCRSPQSKNPVCLLRPDRKNVDDDIAQMRHSDYIESLISRDASEVFQFNFTSITVHGITSDNSAYSNTGYSMRESHTIQQAQKATLQSARVLRSEIHCSHR